MGLNRLTEVSSSFIYELCVFSLSFFFFTDILLEFCLGCNRYINHLLLNSKLLECLGCIEVLKTVLEGGESFYSDCFSSNLFDNSLVVKTCTIAVNLIKSTELCFFVLVLGLLGLVLGSTLSLIW